MTYNTKNTFEGGVAVITGAGSGIGESLARLAGTLGMKVVVSDINLDRADSVAHLICELGGEAISVLTDVADPKSIDHLARLTHDKYGDVKLLINNAGIETLGFSWELPAEAWERTLNINIHGVVHGVRAFAPRMIEKNESSFIANFSSAAGLGIMPIHAPYIISKHAVLAFSECLYLEMKIKQSPVNVSVVLPGPVATRIFNDMEMGSDPYIQAHRNTMMKLLATSGMSSSDAAALILQQIAQRQFWVSTHPELTTQLAQARADNLMRLAKPELTDAMKQLL